MSALKFSKANAKTKKLQRSTVAGWLTGGRKIYSFDILSGWSCPYANQCLSKVKVDNGKRKVVDGPNTEFRCFSASQEVLLTPVYNSRKHNFQAMRNAGDYRSMANLLVENLPNDSGIIRIHVAGDMFSQEYFDAWVLTAAACKDTLFYAYTKSLPYWVKRMGDIPDNLVLTASVGGRRDDMIAEHGLRSATVVGSQYAARKLKLPVDSDDSHAADPQRKNKNFALLIHGTQPKGSEMAKAWQRIRTTVGGYSR